MKTYKIKLTDEELKAVKTLFLEASDYESAVLNSIITQLRQQTLTRIR